MTGNASEYSYDELPYPNLIHGFTHPDHLASLATLLGLSPAPIESCRVLELGCAGGANLINMAYALPGSTFVGIDNGIHHIAAAQTAAQAIGLPNITFQHLDILDVTADLGEFDYIITHGLYSWVPPHVREKILAISKQNLAPNGVAYISYNTYPGWYMLDMVRDMMRYHIRGTTNLRERAQKARSFISFLAESATQAKTEIYSVILNAYTNIRPKHMREAGIDEESTMIHDELAEINDPVYFYEFAEHAAQHGLQYLAEANFPAVMPNNFAEESIQHLREIATSIVETEQYMDFMRNCYFRSTLLCHDDIVIDRNLKPQHLAKLYISTKATRVELDPDAEEYNPALQTFRSSDGATFTTEHPVTQAAMQYLIESAPRPVAFKTLFQEACARLGITTPQPNDAPALATGLLRSFCYSMKLVELHAVSPAFVLQVSERPVASPVARYYAGQMGQIPNPLHELVKMNDLGYLLLPYLDGSRTRQDLIDIVRAEAQAGKITLDGSVESPDDFQPAMEQDIDQTLKTFGEAALLVG